MCRDGPLLGLEEIPSLSQSVISVGCLVLYKEDTMKHLHGPDVESYDCSVFGLEGSKWKLRLLSDSSVWNELEPGGYTPAEHMHDDSIERGVVVSGKGVIIHENDRIEIQSNDFFEIVDGNHQYVNTGNEPLIFVCFRYPR